MRAADLIREARKRAGLPQEELARRLNTTQSVIARWEKGDRDPGLDTLQRIARACDLDLSVGLVPHDDHDLILALQTRDLRPGERIEYMLQWRRALDDLFANARPVK